MGWRLHLDACEIDQTGLGEHARQSDRIGQGKWPRHTWRRHLFAELRSHRVEHQSKPWVAFGRRPTAHASRTVKERIGGLLEVIRNAAPVDADSAALWDLIQSDFHENQRVIVDSLHAKGALRADLDVLSATDILWTVNHPDVWLLLVHRGGWTPA